MAVARGRLENRQAIIRIGLQPFAPVVAPVSPEQPILSLPINAYRALIDTGAQRTCLTNGTITQERLSRHGKRLIQNVHSQAPHSLFTANLDFFCENERGGVSTYHALPYPIEVINIADNDRSDAIIGMDLLHRFDLRFERTGVFEVRLD